MAAALTRQRTKESSGRALPRASNPARAGRRARPGRAAAI